MRSRTDSIVDWVKYIRLDGLPFSFKGHEYLREIYADTSPHIVLSKAAQVGGTSWALLKMFRAGMNGLNVAYFFPTKTDVQDFSRTRVATLLADNPCLGRLVTDTDSVDLKRLGDAFLYFRGMQSVIGMKSFQADLIILDELDETEPQHKKLAIERLSHSDYKRIIELSNPSLPEYGIDEVFQKSDQRHWYMKCPGCQTWTSLEREFPIKLGQEVKIILPRKNGTFYRACPKCQHELDVDQGEWVPDDKDRPIHGYRISQLFSSKVDPGEILQEYQTTQYPERFYNLKIGIPWADIERRLDLTSVLSLCGQTPMLEKCDQNCIMGVDVGKFHHVVILRPDLEDENKYHLVYLDDHATFDTLDALMARFKVEQCVIDSQPEAFAASQFAERHTNAVFLCRFLETQVSGADWNRNDHMVRINRTVALDASRAAIRDKQVVLPRQVPLVETFARHMTADAKILDEDEKTGVQEYRYTRTGDNDFSMAFTYAWLAVADQTGPRAWGAFFRRETRRALRGR